MTGDVFLCPAEDFTSRCDHHGGPTRLYPFHLCNYDDGHSGGHECACGHRWREDDDN